MLRADVESFCDFTIHMTRAKGDAYRAVVRIAPKEEYEIGFRLPVEQDDVTRALASIPSASHMYTQRAASYESVDPLRRIGGLLFSALFEGASRRLYQRAKDDADSEGKGLRLQVMTDQASLAAMPWEFLHDGQDFIGLSVSTPIVRAPLTHVRDTWTPVSSPGLLFIVADLGGYAGIEAIEKDLHDVAGRFPDLRITTVHNPSARELIAAVSDVRYELLYFAGMGADSPDGTQTLVLPNDSGKPGDPYQSLSTNPLRDVLSKRTGLRLAYLCAAHSEQVAQTLSGVCSSVIGIRGAMETSSARAFSHGLLSNLLAGAPLEVAMTRGRQQVDAETPGSREWGLPVLYTQTEPGNVLIARKQLSASESEARDKPGTARPGRLTAKEAERQALDTRLTILTMNFEALQKQKAVTAGAAPATVESQITQIAQEIAAVKGKLDQMS